VSENIIDILAFNMILQGCDSDEIFNTHFIADYYRVSLWKYFGNQLYILSAEDMWKTMSFLQTMHKTIKWFIL